MRSTLIKALSVFGLVIATGPFCLAALAQGYVDVEAERAAAQAAGGGFPVAADDPFAAQPAQTYPATSFGVSNAPPAPAGIAPAAPAPAAPTGGSELGNLFLQIQALQEEVMRLNGKLEEQAHELNTLREQSLQRYMDLDKRLSGGASEPSASAGPPGQAPAGSPPQTPDGAIDASVPMPPPAARGPASAAEQASEAEAYRAAYAMVQNRQFAQAVPVFQQFLQRFPDGVYAANAHYWLGELYLVLEPPDLEASRQSFALLLSQYPDNSKAPDALYKLGRVQFMKGNRERAREYLDLVITQYEGTNDTVVKLARDFIAQNY